jgi:hypothetical protein
MVPVSLFLLSGCQKGGKHQVDVSSQVRPDFNSSVIKKLLSKQMPQARIEERTHTRLSDPQFLNCTPDLQAFPFCSINTVILPITQDRCTLDVTYDIQFCLLGGGTYLANIFNVTVGTFPNVPPCSDITDYWLNLIDNGRLEQAQDSINHFLLGINNQIENLVILSFIYNFNIDCDEKQLLLVDFYASSCTKSCALVENVINNVYCGIGCCRRTTTYCLRDGRIEKGEPYLEQTQACETVPSACDNKVSTPCVTGSCETLF